MWLHPTAIAVCDANPRVGQIAATSRCSFFPLVLHEAPHDHLASPAAIDVARVVGSNAFRHVGTGCDLGDEGDPLAALDAADADAFLEARVALGVFIARLMIGAVKDVVLVNEQP